MDIAVSKTGKGVVVTCGLRGMKSQAMSIFPATYCVELVAGWSVSFGAQVSPTDFELTQYLINITAPWDDDAKTYRKPRRIYLSEPLWRAGDQGEIVVQAREDFPAEKRPNEMNSQIPWNTAFPRAFIEAMRPEEVKALLKFGRDSK
jgi:hypothetical protein